MKTPTLIGQIGIAVALTLACYPTATLLQYWLSPEIAIKTLFGLLMLTYIVYLCVLAPTRPGKVILVSISTILAGIFLWTDSSPLALVALAAGFFCLSRTLLFYRNFIGFLSDAILQTGAVFTSVWAYSTNGSLLLAVWCFFLCQALWVLIPIGVKQAFTRSHSNTSNDHFSHAHRMAEAALATMFRES